MTPFAEAYDRAKQRIAHYGIEVKIGDVLDPNTGDFNGEEITVDYNQEVDSALFVVLHLFGHTVQWNISDALREIGLDVSIGKSEEHLQRSRMYERGATRYGMQLIHEAGITDLDRWITDWWEADWRYLSHYYRTGEKPDFRAQFQLNCGELLTAEPIPPFQPRRWQARWAF
jgi:hypothetical protein